jgi:hypothetical protein
MEVGSRAIGGKVRMRFLISIGSPLSAIPEEEGIFRRYLNTIVINAMSKLYIKKPKPPYPVYM